MGVGAGEAVYGVIRISPQVCGTSQRRKKLKLKKKNLHLWSSLWEHCEDPMCVSHLGVHPGEWARAGEGWGRL